MAGARTLPAAKTNAGEVARDSLRILLGFKSTLEGSVPLGEKVQIAAACAKVEGALSRISAAPEFSEDARTALGYLAGFVQGLPDFTDRNMKARRAARDNLKEAVRHVARIVAISNRAERKRQE